MLRILQLTDDVKQKHNLILDDGTVIELTIEFKPLQYGWFITSLIYGTVEIKNFRIVVSPNFLYQFKNILPFGICCSAKREPTQQKDFSSEFAKLYVVTKEENIALTEFLSGAV
jgi:hypothetical protein